MTWFIGFWDKLVAVRPELGRLPLAQRQKTRTDSLAAWAVTIHGYIRLARRFYDEGLDLTLLDKLAEKHTEPDGQVHDLFEWKNPLWQRAGIVVPAVSKAGKHTLTVRNSHQTRRAMAQVLADHLQLPDPEPAPV